MFFGEIGQFPAFYFFIIGWYKIPNVYFCGSENIKLILVCVCISIAFSITFPVYFSTLMLNCVLLVSHSKTLKLSFHYKYGQLWKTCLVFAGWIRNGHRLHIIALNGPGWSFRHIQMYNTIPLCFTGHPKNHRYRWTDMMKWLKNYRKEDGEKGLQSRNGEQEHYTTLLHRTPGMFRLYQKLALWCEVMCIMWR